jgi:hypothetical protein
MCRAMWRVTPPTTTHARVSIGAHHEQVRTLVGEAGENLIANTDIWCHHSLPRCLDSVASKASRDPQVSSQSRPPIAPRPVDNHHPRGSVAVGGLQFLCCSTWLRGSALRRASSASAILDQHSHKASKRRSSSSSSVRTSEGLRSFSPLRTLRISSSSLQRIAEDLRRSSSGPSTLPRLQRP